MEKRFAILKGRERAIIVFEWICETDLDNYSNLLIFFLSSIYFYNGYLVCWTALNVKHLIIEKCNIARLFCLINILVLNICSDCSYQHT